VWNEIPDDEWDTGLEFWAKEYLKGEGVPSSYKEITAH